MNTLHTDFSEGLWKNCPPPCLSLYQPTHRKHPDNQQDPIRFGNLVKTLKESLLQSLSEEEATPLLAPFLALADDRAFWNCTRDGLAVLSAKDFFRVYTLQRPVPELAIVADSFHTKPLLKILQSADRYQLLAVNRQAIRLFEGNRDALDEIEPAGEVPKTITEALGDELTEPRQTSSSYGGRGSGDKGGGQSPMFHGHGGKKDEVDSDAERFFRAVDRAVLEHHSKPSGLPLILAALPEHHHTFHAVSHNPLLVPESLDVHPDALSSIDELRTRTWELMEPRYQARLAALAEEFRNASSKGLGTDDLAQVAKATVEGRVATLLIEADRQRPGRVDAANGKIEFDDLSHPEFDDVLDDLAELAIGKGGKAIVVPADQMPTQAGVAAIYRY